MPLLSIWDPSHISETTRARKVTFYSHLDGSITHFKYENFCARGRAGAQHPQRKFRAAHISVTIGARKLKFYTHLDRAKYSFQA